MEVDFDLGGLPQLLSIQNFSIMANVLLLSILLQQYLVRSAQQKMAKGITDRLDSMTQQIARAKAGAKRSRELQGNVFWFTVCIALLALGVGMAARQSPEVSEFLRVSSPSMAVMLVLVVALLLGIYSARYLFGLYAGKEPNLRFFILAAALSLSLLFPLLLFSVLQQL